MPASASKPGRGAVFPRRRENARVDSRLQNLRFLLPLRYSFLVVLRTTVLILIARVALCAQAAPPNVCATQNQRSAAKKTSGPELRGQAVRVRGRAIFSPRGFWLLTEPGCAAIPIAEILESVRPKVTFELVKDENYRKLQDSWWQSRQSVIAVELEGRLDPIRKGLRDPWKGGSGALHMARYKYTLVLRQVLAVETLDSAADHANESTAQKKP